MHVPLVATIALLVNGMEMRGPVEVAAALVVGLLTLLLVGRVIGDLWTTADVDDTTRVWWLSSLIVIWGPALAAYWWWHVRDRGPARLHT